MKKLVAVFIIAIFAMMILTEPLWALTTWSNPGVNPTTIPPGKAVTLFKGLSDVQKLKIAYTIATTSSFPTSVLPGEQFTEMTEGNNGVKQFICVGGIDTLQGQYWIVDGVEVVQFVACNNLAWRPICPISPPPMPAEDLGPVMTPTEFPSTISEVLNEVPPAYWPIYLPAAGLQAIWNFLFH